MRRRLAIPLMLIAAAAGAGGVLYAQLESGDRGIAPLDTSNTLEIGGIHVDASGVDPQAARYAGWRMAQREAFKALWAKMHHSDVGAAPGLPDGTLDQIVSSINVESEQIGPNRYIANLGVQFDRGRASPFLGVAGGNVSRSVPMLLIPVTITAGAATSVELRNAWQRAWAQMRTSQSAIDYVRVSGLGGDPLLINAAQTTRPGRGWWRNLIEMYGAADILVAEVQLQRLYPGGPAKARFIARHGPDNEIIGGFTLTAPNSEGIPAMMADGARRMDELYVQALGAGRMQRDNSLDLPPPPALPELPPVPTKAVVQVASSNAVQVQVSGKNINFYNFAMAHLHTIAGVETATPQQINPGGTSYILVKYKGSIGQLAAALGGRGWVVEVAGTALRIRSSTDQPPAMPPPPVQAPPVVPPGQVPPRPGAGAPPSPGEPAVQPPRPQPQP